jgi:hypothetical protein
VIKYLDIYQGPAFDKIKKSHHIFWVGLSAVQFQEGQERVPLSSETQSGSLIEAIEEPFRRQFSFYKTNLVSRPLKTSDNPHLTMF